MFELPVRSLPLAVEDVVSGEITTAEGIRAGLVLVGAIVLSIILRRLLIRALDREHADRHVGRLIGRFGALVIVAVGTVYALGVLGVRIGPLIGALGIGGIALAFAAQDTLENFVAGMMLQIRRPLRVGEEIKTGDFEGFVEDVNLRTVELTTYDGLTVFVPNAEVLRAPIVNYTRTPLNRTSLTVGLAYGTDLDRARDVLLAACGATAGVAGERPPEVWVEEFADSAINLAVRYWHTADIASRWRVRNAVAISISTALAEADMTIPFPQRTLWFGPGSTSLHVVPDEPPSRQDP